MTAVAKKDSAPKITNRKAFRDYSVLERYEAGIELVGSEVKSVREGRIDLSPGFCMERNGQLFLNDVHISPYEHANQFNHEPARSRRLLLRKREIRIIGEKLAKKGLTLLPLNIHFAHGWVKIELGLCKGKKMGDKRETLKKRTSEREAAQAIARAQRR